MLGRYEKAYFINEATKDHGASEWPKENSSSLCLIQKHMFLTKPYSFKTNYLAKICSCKYTLYFFFLQTCPRELLISRVSFSTRKFSFVTEPLHVLVFLSVKLKSFVLFLPLGGEKYENW